MYLKFKMANKLLSIDVLTGRPKIYQFFIDLFPKKLRGILNPNRRSIEIFIHQKAKEIKKGSLVLDAGAGLQPYKNLFNHCKYESTDFTDPFKNHTFVCSLDKMPVSKNKYDAIICTQVLEHVEHPKEVINEFYRVLKKNGKLYLTVPQEWMLHQEPYNFFYFTKYGLKSLLKNAGFRNYKITPQGGYFWFLADAIRFNSILQQYKKNKILYYPLRAIEFPITSIIIPILLFPLDFLDKEKKWTMGYLVEATK